MTCLPYPLSLGWKWLKVALGYDQAQYPTRAKCYTQELEEPQTSPGPRLEDGGHNGAIHGRGL